MGARGERQRGRQLGGIGGWRLPEGRWGKGQLLGRSDIFSPPASFPPPASFLPPPSHSALYFTLPHGPPFPHAFPQEREWGRRLTASPSMSALALLPPSGALSTKRRPPRVWTLTVPSPHMVTLDTAAQPES
eukprot:254870-Chlamydomonas_euryale.AAC.1